MNSLKIVLIDVDGVMCNGKYYDQNGDCFAKRFNDLDFTAIKMFKACGVDVVFVTSDPFNQGMASKRGIACSISRSKDGRIDKVSSAIRVLEEKGLSLEDAAYIGDDIFDIPLLRKVAWGFCPANAALSVHKEPNVSILPTRSGNGVILSMFNWFVRNNTISEPSIEEVIELDSNEYK